jgi:hypothetical protein
MSIENLIVKIVNYILYLLGINVVGDKEGVNNELKQKYDDL